jgi:hypothetical protein
LSGKINRFRAKKRVDIRRYSAKFPSTMKSDSLNGTLTFILGVLVVLGVICAVRMVMITHELRQLQKEATRDNFLMAQMRGVLNDTQLYYQKYQDPKLAQILQSVSRPAHH